MLNEETKRKLRLMNIGEFIEAIETQSHDPQTLSLSFDERFQRITDAVYQEKYNDKVKRFIKNAKFRLPKADVHDILYADNRPINRGIMDEVASCRFVEECRSIVFQGYTSSGKTFLGCAVGKEACRQQYRVRYIRLPELLSEYADKASLTGGRTKVLNKYAAFNVLILDEWLIQDLSKDDIEFIFELSDYRQENWVKRLGGGAYAESIVERFAYNVTWVETGDTNMRQIYTHA